jgi:hypothetical protein
MSRQKHATEEIINFYRIEATAINDPTKHFIGTKKMLLLK